MFSPRDHFLQLSTFKTIQGRGKKKQKLSANNLNETEDCPHLIQVTHISFKRFNLNKFVTG